MRSEINLEVDRNAFDGLVDEHRQQESQTYHQPDTGKGRTPFAVRGKPEPLRHELSGFSSRRIDAVKRLVYAVTDDEIRITACQLRCARWEEVDLEN